MKNKIVYIMRGLPGSGKSYLAKKLGESGVVLSTDDFFETDDGYKFDHEKLGSAHKWNQERAFKHIDNEVSPVVIDNTNIFAWESKLYVEYAMKNNYEVKIVLSNSPWAFDLDELEKRNTHNVPREVLQKMLIDFKKDLSIQDILDSSVPTESKNYCKY